MGLVGVPGGGARAQSSIAHTVASACHPAPIRGHLCERARGAHDGTLRNPFCDWTWTPLVVRPSTTVCVCVAVCVSWRAKHLKPRSGALAVAVRQDETCKYAQEFGQHYCLRLARGDVGVVFASPR